MDIQYTIQKELQDLNSNLPLERPQLYEVPDGYFENLANEVLSKIKRQDDDALEEIQSLSPFLASISRKMPFSVPDHYFEQNNENIPPFFGEPELPAVLTTVGKKMPYTVPERYFETFPAQILNKVTKPKAKVFSFNTNKWMRYAAAAVITGAIALGGIAYFTNQSSVDPVKHPYEWIAKKLQNVSTQDLENFIKTTDPSASQQQVVKNSSPSKEVRKLLKDVPTSELSNFLSSVPNETDELSATN